jgi:hypothetical protein
VSDDPQLQAVIELARELPAEIPDPAHREEVRTALLARQPLQRPQRRYWLALSIVAVAASAAVYFAPARDQLHAVAFPVMPTVPEKVARGHVHPHEGAAFELASTVPDEIVRLHDGTIDVEVDPLQQHERFRVVVGASEIEVRGTAFTVTAEHERLIDVHVAHGRVEVRPVGRANVVLGAGAMWKEPVPPPIVVIAPVKRVSVHAPSVDQLAYDDAWSALREKRFDDAIVAFGHTLAAAPDGPLADDARFWQAVAYGRAQKSAEAMHAFRTLVDEHPGSSHASEASVMLGWLLVDAKQFAEARERFGIGVDNQNASVRASARAGIAALK